MSNLKRRFIEAALVVVILLTLSSGRVFGQEVHPLRDLMLIPTNNVYAEYGYSEDTFRFFNFVKLKEACQIFEGQIKVLRAEIDELKKQVAGLQKTTGAFTVTAPSTKPAGSYCMNDSHESCGMPDIECLKHPFDPCQNTDPRFRRFGRQVPVREGFADPNDVERKE